MAVVRQGDGRAYIEGVRRISWHTGQMCEFAAALVSAMRTLGETIPYHTVMGTSGAAFRLTLNQDPWNPGSYGITCVAEDPHAPIRRAFHAIGRRFDLRETGRQEDDAAAILASIHQGTPVLAFGVVGPSDCSLIAGYDEDGRVLLGWSTFQDIPDDHNVPHDATGYFRKPEWHANTRGYLLIGAKTERPPAREVYLDALRWAAELARQTSVRGMPAGLGAYPVWADAMLDDARFPAPDAPAQAFGGPYLGILCILMMVDDRAAAVDFLEQAARDLPDLAPELLAAAASYRETCALRASLRGLMPEDFSELAMRRLADGEIRREYARRIRAMGARDAAATERVERCLARV